MKTAIKEKPTAKRTRVKPEVKAIEKELTALEKQLVKLRAEVNKLKGKPSNVPNAETRKAMEDARKGKNIKKFNSFEELIKDLKK